MVEKPRKLEMKKDELQDFIDACNRVIISVSDEASEAFEAREYLHVRGLSEASISRHKIGYCSSDYDIPHFIKTFGNELIDGEDRDLSYNILGRIIVPVFDEFGKAVGLATRKPTFQKGNTWWNLPSPFYKGNHLFLLDKSKTSAFLKNKMYIVEGYMDAIILYQNGLKNIVALMGTDLSLRKIGLIARYCENICFCFDVDKNLSGQNAKKQSIAVLDKLSVCDTISVIEHLPVGMDPDEYVIKNGIDHLLFRERIISKPEIADILKEIKEDKRKKMEDARKSTSTTK